MALPLYLRAIEIDPEFAMAYARLGHVYGEIGESDLSAEATTKAYQLRSRASDAEKFFITASYDLRVTGNMEHALPTLEALAQTYPRESTAHGFQAGIVYQVTGKYEKAVEEATKAISLDPDFPLQYDVLSTSYQFLGRLPEAENALKRASERKLEVPYETPIHKYDIAFFEGRQGGNGKSGGSSARAIRG